MSRLDPKNREEAFAHQFEADVVYLKKVALTGMADGFDLGIKRLEAHISAYRNKKLKKNVERAIKKSEERDAYMRKQFPTLYKKHKP